MLIQYEIENWMSFRDPFEFSMVPSRERRHKERIPRLELDKAGVLPVAAIFGGNASGKSNFVKSLEFARKFVVDGIVPDEFAIVRPFRLDMKYHKKPTRFNFVIAMDERIFEFEFAVKSGSVDSESLFELEKSRHECIYDIKNGKLSSNSFESVKSREIFEKMFERKKKDQLFLTLVAKFTDLELPIYDWFKDNLTIVYPSTKFSPEQFIEDSCLLSNVNEILKYIDCGISKIEVKEISQNGKKSHKNEKRIERQKITEGLNGNVRFDAVDEWLPNKLVTYHSSKKNELFGFELEEESIGTLRVLELLPLIFELSKDDCKKVFIIDEFDRSLHTRMSQSLLSSFLENCNSKTRSQVVFTTHDIFLMDQLNFRRDEMWLVERDESGASDFFSVGEINDVHLEKRLRQSYLDGRLGGVPNLYIIGDHFKESSHMNKEQRQ